MNQVLTLKFVKEVNGRTYTFDLPVGAPFGEAYDVCHEVLTHITKMASDAAEKAKKDVTPATDATTELM
jgi:hypothetical protein